MNDTPETLSATITDAIEKAGENAQNEIHDLDLDCHGIKVNISSSMIKVAIVAAATYISAHTKAPYEVVAASVFIAAGAAYSLYDHLWGSNKRTDQLF